MRRVTLYVLLIASLIGATGCQQVPEEGEPPVITLPGGHVYQLTPGDSLTLSPGFEHLTDGAVIRWIQDDQVVGGDPSFRFL